MVSRPTLMIGAMSVGLASATTPVICKAAATPSLAETLSWMDSTYNSHEREGGSFGYGVYVIYNEKGGLFKRRTQRLTYNGCDATLTTKEDPTGENSRDLYSVTTERFNLRDIDPKSFTMIMLDSHAGGLNCKELAAVPLTCDEATLTVETANQRPLISDHTHVVFPKLAGKDHENVFDSKSYVVEIYLSDVKYAARFDSALRHAVELCGGKQSTF